MIKMNSRLNLFICLVFMALSFLEGSARGAIIHVDGSYNGTADGSALHPFVRISQAIAVSQNGDTIKVASGNYSENIIVPSKTGTVSMIGGFSGVAGGGFNVADPAVNVTVITGDMTSAVITFQDLVSGELNGFVIRNGTRGIISDGWVAAPGVLTIRNCTIEDNGTDTNPNGTGEWYGGGLYLRTPDINLSDSIIRNNRAGRGAGLTSGRNRLVMENCVVENNTGSSDHGGGAFISGPATIRNCLFKGNSTTAWGGGLIVNAAESASVLIENSVFTDNMAGSYGAGLFLDDGSRTVIRNSLIVKNRASRSGGAIAVDGMGGDYVTHVDMENCTIADNDPDGENSSAITMDANTRVTVRNSILWGHRRDVYDRRQVDNIIGIDYSITQYGAAGSGNIQSDPLFVNAIAGDYHLKSKSGHWSVSGFVSDGVNSPGVDAGDPATAFLNEPLPNGGRINLGAYGNTEQASKSSSTVPLNRLTLIVGGDGGGTVSSNPSGISYGQGNNQFSASFNAGVDVQLFAVPDSQSTFGGWSSCGIPCKISMDGDKQVTVSFNAAPKAKIGAVGYPSLAAAYNAANVGQTTRIMLLDGFLNESLVLKKDIELQGGYNATYSDKTGDTVLNGTLIVEAGRLVVGGIALR